MHRIKLFVLFLMLLAFPVFSLAQECDLSTGFIPIALEQLSELCQGMGKNQICYGTQDIEATQVSNLVEDFNFDDPGDIENLANIGSVNLEPLTLQNPNWATALILAQAVLPNSLPGQNITILLVGDVQLIPLGEDSGGVQSFSFSTGIGRTICNEFNLDGMFIQTASTTDRQALNINGARVELSSLAFVSTNTNDDALFQISMMNGHSWVNTEGSDQKDIGTGQQLTVYESGPADPQQSEYYTDPYVQSISQYMDNVYGHCTLSNVLEITFPVRVGPGLHRGPALLLPVGDFEVIGKNTDSEGQLWWKLNKNNPLISFSAANELWVLDDSRLIKSGDCDAIQDASAPPVIVPVVPAIDTNEYHPTLEVIGEATEEYYIPHFASIEASPTNLTYAETYTDLTIRVAHANSAMLYVSFSNQYINVVVDVDGGYHISLSEIPTGSHFLNLIVEDLGGNIYEYYYVITRAEP